MSNQSDTFGTGDEGDGKSSAVFKVKGKQIHKHYIDARKFLQKNKEIYLFCLYGKKGFVIMYNKLMRIYSISKIRFGVAKIFYRFWKKVSTMLQ